MIGGHFADFIGIFNTINSFYEKKIGRRWGQKREGFPLLGGRRMFRRETGSKRGDFPPKEGNLTYMPNGTSYIVTEHFR